MITVRFYLLPGTTTEYFFTGSIANTSAYDLNFDQQFDDAFRCRSVGLVSAPVCRPGPAEGVLSYTGPNSGLPSWGGLLQQPMFGSCLWGVVGSVHRAYAPGLLTTAQIAAALRDSSTAPGIYARNLRMEAGHPAHYHIPRNLLPDGRVKSFTQDSPGSP
mgnify:CR=1 FL=1